LADPYDESLTLDHIRHQLFWITADVEELQFPLELVAVYVVKTSQMRVCTEHKILEFAMSGYPYTVTFRLYQFQSQRYVWLNIP
jgi:hypothetical protein